jgi:small subunit ribosomal protein S17
MKQERLGKSLTGNVVRIGTNKTIVVEVVTISHHPLYQKTMRKTKRYLVHYEGNTVREGDVVTIFETKPMSKNKHFAILEKKGK